MSAKAVQQFKAIQARYAKAARRPPSMAVARPAVAGAVNRIGQQLSRQGIPVRAAITPRGDRLRVTMTVPRGMKTRARAAVEASIKKDAPRIRALVAAEAKKALS